MAIDDNKARSALLKWARQHWANEETGQSPLVSILSLRCGEDGDYEAVLSVSSSEDNPSISFFFDEHGHIHIQVEY